MVAGRVRVLMAFVLVFSGCRRLEHYAVCHHQDHVQDSFSSVPQIAATSYRHETARVVPALSLADDPQYWELSCDDCLRLALVNSEIIHTVTGSVLNSPETVATVYDRELQRSEVLFGRRSSVSALADFDPVLRFDGVWGRSDRLLNSQFTGAGFVTNRALSEDTADFDLSLSKRLPAGGDIRISQLVDYDSNNSSANLFASAYTTEAVLSYRQPILAGAGYQFNSIAGPLSGGIRGVTGVSQGLLIAQINERISQVEFQATVNRLMADTTEAYWRLRGAYDTLESLKKLEPQVEEGVRVTKGREKVGADGGGADEVAAVADFALSLQEEVLTAEFRIMELEEELRKLMSLPTDGSLIRPTDSPFDGELVLDWNSSVDAALQQRPEIRLQKEEIRSLQYQLRAAENVALPTLDFVSSFSLNGFGDDLLGTPSTPGRPGSALGLQYDGDQTSWTLGFQYERPLGLRQARTQIQNIQLQTRRATAVLRAQEAELESELRNSMRQVHRDYLALRIQKERHDKAKQRLQTAKARYMAAPDQTSVQSLIQTASAVSQAEQRIIAATTQYNTATSRWQLAVGDSLLPESTAFAP